MPPPPEGDEQSKQVTFALEGRVANSALTGIGEAEIGQDNAHTRFLQRGLGLVFVVQALCVQRAMHQQVGAVRSDVNALFARLLRDDGCAQDQVGHDHGRVLMVESQHIRRMVLVAVLAVERAAFVCTHGAHRDLT